MGALGILGEIERLEKFTGHLNIAGAVSGTIVLEDGLVCWANLRPREIRLSELLRAAVPESRSAELDGVLRRCVRDRTNVREALVSAKLLTGDRYNLTVRQHIARVFVALSNGHTAGTRVTKSPGSSARFTTAELLSGMGCHLAAAVPSDTERQLLSDAVAGEGFGAIYSDSEAGAVPVDVIPGRSLPALIQIGRWALRGAPQTEVLIKTRSGHALFAWCKAPFHYVVGSSGPLCFERATIRIRGLRRSFASVANVG